MKYLLMAVVCFSSCEEPLSHSETDTETQPEIRDPRFEILDEAIEADLAENPATAASVAVWLDGEIMWVGGYGSADAAGGPPPDEETLFMIGSDTKKITAISLLRKVDKEMLGLDTTVSEILPELEMPFAPDFLGATVHDLLSHQGGIVDSANGTNSTTDEALESYVFGEFAETYYSMAPPGTFFNYSNPNFSIAGLLDQRIDGRMWADIVTEDVFVPLKMTRTVARKSEVDGNYATGVGWIPNEDSAIGPVSLADIWESAFVRPAGLVWSTPTDQMRLARFLVEGNDRVLDSDLLDEITTPHVAIYPDDIVEASLVQTPVIEMPSGGYGYGMFIQQGLDIDGMWYDVPVWGHGGNTLTHTSTFLILPEQHFAISILSNGIGNDFTDSVTAAIEALVALPPATAAPVTPFDSAALDGFVGAYIDPYMVGEIHIARVGDGLSVELPMLDDDGVPYVHDLEPVSTHVWLVYVDGMPYTVTFIEGSNGEMYLRNRGFVALLLPDDGIELRARAQRRVPAIDSIQFFPGPVFHHHPVWRIPPR